VTEAQETIVLGDLSPSAPGLHPFVYLLSIARLAMSISFQTVP